MFITTLISCTFMFTPLEVDSSQSSVGGQLQLSTFIPGTLIGNWDAKTNPEGTSTLPGYFGGSGNNPISCELTPSLSGSFATSCDGGLQVEIYPDVCLMSIDNLHIEANLNSPASFPLILGTFYETFRTEQPDSLYPGGIPLDIPLGEGSLSVLHYDQALETVAIITPIDTSSWSYETIVLVGITMDLEFLGASSGQFTIPGVLGLSGTVERTNTEILLTGSATLKISEEIGNLPIEFYDLPIDLPTIIPLGETSHLLLSAVAKSVAISTSGDLQLSASGIYSQGDVDGDGEIGTSDLLAIIDMWGVCENCSEDVNGDFLVDVTDLYIVIGNWTG